jgi:predicted transcriptional regulator
MGEVQAKVSRSEFDAYYASQESGVGIWVDAAELLPSPIKLYGLRQNWGNHWQPPQQIQQLSAEQALLIRRNPITHTNHDRALLSHL